MNRLPNQLNSETRLTCQLPLGPLVHGRRERKAVLRKLGEELQLRLFDVDFALPREQAVSEALAICVEQIGTVSDPPADLMDELTLNDRHALVRALLLAWGEPEISTAAICTRCSRKLELSLDLTAIPLPNLPDSGTVVIVNGRKAGAPQKELRIPIAREFQEAHDEATLLGLCLGCTPMEAKKWIKRAEKTLSRLDPLGHLEILGKCTDCGRSVRAETDPVAHWLSVLRAKSTALLEDIHRLAMRYHWTEKEILGLPDVRRQAYLDLS